MFRRPLRRLSTLVVVLVLTGLGTTAAPAAADIVPFVDCVTPGTGPVNVYFGYTNDGETTSIPFGEQNEIVPGLGYQGQPTVFNKGTYQRVFRAVWNQTAFTGIAWDLNGHVAIATRSGPSPSPTCVAGTTGPASGVTETTATLSALVGVAGQPTTYHFEYGVGESLDLSTPAETVEVGRQALVQTHLTGLAPGTTYAYRVVATNEDETTEGDLGTFKTATAPAPPTPTPEGGGTVPPTTTPGGGGTVPSPTTTAGAVPPPPKAAPFAITVRPAAPRLIAAQRRACPARTAAGAVITANAAGTAALIAKVGKLTVASRRLSLAEGRNVVALCLNKTARDRLEAAPRPSRSLRARLVVEARTSTAKARASTYLSFTRAAARH
jgi:hypothetical protein